MKQPLRKTVVFFAMLLFATGYAGSSFAQAVPASISVGKDTILAYKQSTPTSIDLKATISGNPASVLWSKVTGAAGLSFSSTTSMVTSISGLKPGFYSFKCDVLNVSGISILSDIINVTVVDYQKKNRVPCRTGGPKTWVLSATSTWDLVRPYLRRDGMDIQGGDTIKINRNPNNNGLYGRLYLGDFGGDEGCPVVVVPNGQVVEIGGPSSRWHLGKNNNNTSDSNFVNHVIIDGTYLRSKGIEYGFQTTSTAWGLSTTMVTDLEIKGVLFENNSLGIQMKIYSDSSYAWTVYDNFIMKNIKIHDNYFHNITANEGMYVGHTSQSGTTQANNDGPTVRMDSVFIYNNIIDSTGWDPMQTSSARYVEMHDNIILNASRAAASSQNWGLLMGGNCTGKIYNNLVYNGTSCTVGSMGYGKTDIYYNFIGNTTGAGIYVNGITSNILEATLPGKFPPMQLTVRDNLIAGFETRAIQHANNDKRAIAGAIRNNYIVDATKTAAQSISTNAPDQVADNTMVTSFPVQVKRIGVPQRGVLIEVKQGTAVDTFSTSKEAIDWLFSRLNVTPPPNQAPVARAGADKSVTLPVSGSTLDGSGSNDPDGTIVSYAWTRISGPAKFTITSATAAQTTITGLEEGVYQFRLVVKDNAGATAADTVQVTVNAAVMPPNNPPAAAAGSDVTITLPTSSVIVSAAGSTDSDGTIVSYGWTKIAGPAQFTIATPGALQTTVTGLVAGTYQFRVVVTDDKGATASDTIKVTVNPASVPPPPANVAPTAAAGNDKYITLPLNNVNLSGAGSTDPDGTITGWAWTKIAGPSSFTIASPSAIQTAVTGLAAGTYEFQLRVQDNNGATDLDTVRVIVSPATPPANVPPVANAGADVELVLPENATTLTSLSTDADGSIVSFTWRKLSGPAAGSLQGVNSTVLKLSGLEEGVYQLELTVTDNSGAIAKDNVSVRVSAALNNPPVVFAGNDTTVLVPATVAMLNGRAYDSDGSISAVSWKLIDGKGHPSISDAASLQAMLTGFEEGTYTVELTAWDNLGASASATVKVTVRGAAPSTASLFPNPATGHRVNLKIDANTTTSQTSIRIYDMSQKLVYQEHFKRTTPSVTRDLDISKLPAGFYVVVATVDLQNQYTCKLVKQ